jgi:hypothetical protein
MKLKKLTLLLIGLLAMMVWIGCRQPTNAPQLSPTPGASMGTLAPALVPITSEPTAITPTPPVKQRASWPLFTGPDYFGYDSLLDLDSGGHHPFSAVNSYDIHFTARQVNGETIYLLRPVNGASTAGLTMSKPGFAGCQSHLEAYQRQEILQLEKGVYFCVLTNLGHLSEIEIESVGVLGEGSIRLWLTTWDEMFHDHTLALATADPLTPTPITPTPTPLLPTGTPPSDVTVYRTGTARLTTTLEFPDQTAAFLDLDSGEAITTTSDLKFAVSAGSGVFYFFRAVNGATARSYPREPAYRNCEQAISLFSEGNNPEIPIGTYYCLLTNELRLARLRIEDMDLREEWIEVSYIVWEAPEE